MDRNTGARVLLVLYVVGTVTVALPLVLNLAGDLSNTTSGKILAAALIALGAGAALAIRDPWADRRMIQVLIVFTSLATLAIVYRLALPDSRCAANSATTGVLFSGTSGMIRSSILARFREPDAIGFR